MFRPAAGKAGAVIDVQPLNARIYLPLPIIELLRLSSLAV